MIHGTLAELLSGVCPELTWTTQYFRENDNTGTVYLEDGDDPHQFDPEISYPSFGVLIRSSDWDRAERCAYLVSKTLHKRINEYMSGYLYKDGKKYLRIDYHVLSIMQSGSIMDLGEVEDGVREWKVNFDTRLHKIKEEEL